jgi:hypothetical protein
MKYFYAIKQYMGILRHHLEILFIEATKENFVKDKKVLCLGQQAVHFSLPEIYKIAQKHSKLKLFDLPKNFDSSNKIPTWVGTKHEKNTNVQTIFKLLGADEVLIADISEYENPDLLINFNNPVSKDLSEKFDLIFDCGTLEHIFDVPTALSSLTSMVRTNGNIYIAVPSSNSIDHGLYSFSPGLFFDYFLLNGFENRGCYLYEGSPIFYKKRGRLYKYHCIGNEIPILSSLAIETIALFKKSTTIAETTKPIQSIYQNSSLANQSSDSGLRKRLIKVAFNFLELIQNFLPAIVEITIVKIRNRLSNNNISFIKKI